MSAYSNESVYYIPASVQFELVLTYIFNTFVGTFSKNGKNDSKKIAQHNFDKFLKQEIFASDFCRFGN
jgi:hypothetical protein